ncbi:hypothetical protein G9C85_16230 [Halorubellus sp. JP-L1]|uniref:HalOD1 output domain-containing protein n=1 Tax=Halorubellus sp. JP-L1 TaxID=2715753 RepID=UPI00140A94A3|nr:HalOD1 output domain-containing protein [Halorubellus sp. JP-L1]NHN43167.1 hypothetical protein [Halorubellus sp. JP-L1]
MNESNVQTEPVAGDRPTKQIVEFDPVGSDSVTARMATAVADATDRDVTELPPLGEWVDCDAIEQLFAGHDHANELSLSFEFENCQVFVSNVGRIVVTPDSLEVE